MNKRLVLHVDGSRAHTEGRHLLALGWGLVALHDDQHHERQGNLVYTRDDPFTGYHEHLAVVQGILYAHELGIEFSNVTLFTDDQVFGYAQQRLHPENYRQAAGHALRTRLRTLVNRLFPPEVFDLVLKALNEMLIVWVKGHQNHVYQERVDYLARTTARRCLGLEESPHLLYDEWLARGFVNYRFVENGAPERTVFFPPFVEASNSVVSAK